MASNNLKKKINTWLNKLPPTLRTVQKTNNETVVSRSPSPLPSTSRQALDQNVHNISPSNSSVSSNKSEHNIVNDDSDSNDENSNDSSDFQAFKEQKTNQFKIFENNVLRLYVYKALHQKRTRFRFLDSMFHVKVLLKDNSKIPFLSDLLDVLNEALKYMVQHIKTFFNKSLNHVGYFTLYQSPMINGLNSGGFDLENDASLAVDDLLSMLNNFLISNESLQLNDTFKVYLHVLSLEHLRHKGISKKINYRKRAKKRKKHYGSRRSLKGSLYQFLWAIDIAANLLTNSIFKNACLLVSLILADLQSKFYDFEPNKDSRFLKAQHINSLDTNKQNKAIEILVPLLASLRDYLKVPEETLIDIEKFAPLLSEYFNCQIFIFQTTENSNSLKYQFPPEFNPALKPFYLYEPLDDPSHVIFIKNLKPFFRQNGTTCKACHKFYKSINYRHLCQKFNSCFACRRFIATPDTYLNNQNLKDFCLNEISISSLESKCELCNLNLLSEDCKNYHRMICGKKGILGYKCLKCNKFTYRTKENKTCAEIKLFHKCGQKICRICKEYYLDDVVSPHLCKLRKILIVEEKPNLCYFDFAFSDMMGKDCFECFKLKQYFRQKYNLTWQEVFQHDNIGNLNCTLHQIENLESKINLIVIFKEIYEKPNYFQKIVLSNFDKVSISIEDTYFIPHELNRRKKGKNIKHSSKKSEQLQHVITYFENKSDFTLLNVFFKMLISKDFENYTFICCDETGYKMDLINNLFLTINIIPKAIHKNSRLLSLKIDSFKQNYLISNSYLVGNEFDMAKQMDIVYESLFFPLSFNMQSNYFYEGNIPNFDYFIELNDSADVVKEKEIFYNTQLNKCWSFQSNLIDFITLKVELLMKALNKLCLNCFDLQKLFDNEVSEQNPNFKKYLHLFNSKTASFPGFIYYIFRAYFLYEENIFAICHEYGQPTKQTSSLEFEWASYNEFEFPTKEYRSEFNHPRGQKFFKFAIPDLYSEKEKEALFFNGCFYHSHFNNCLLNPSATKDTFNPLQKKSYELVNNAFNQKLENLLLNYPTDIKDIKVTWECQFKFLIKESENFKRFLNSVYHSHPLVKLRPRTCVRGGFLQCFALQWKKSDFPNETFYALDINGLYSYITLNFSFINGPYEIIIGNNINEISIYNNKIYFKKQRIFGAMLVNIIPPKNLIVPFLPYRLKNGKNVYTLCLSCAENNKTECQHPDSKRSFTSVYLINEIEYALTLGYKIKRIFECHAFKRQKNYFKKFVEVLNIKKIQNSNVLSNKLESEDKQNYCEFLNQEMNVPNHLKLTPSNISNNPANKLLYKLAANALFGKFLQHQNQSKIELVSSQKELEEKYYSNPENIENIICRNDKFCEIFLKPDELKLPPNRNVNVYIGAQITSLARQTIHSILMSISNLSYAKLFYCDTDSVFFSLPSCKSLSDLDFLKISDSVGSFKHIYQEPISAFYCLGPKNYCILLDSNTNTRNIVKVRGLSLEKPISSEKIDSSTYERFLEYYAKNQFFKKTIDQTKIKRSDKLNLHLPHFQLSTLTNDIKIQRIIKKDSIFSSMPFGYKKET